MSTPESWKPEDSLAARLGEILLEARSQPTPEAREHYLDQACGNDPALRAQVVSLLEAEAAAGDFLGQTALGDLNELEAEGPGTRIGPYTLLEKIGEGGFGTVYVAEQEKPIQRRVALKIIKLGMDTRQVVARFEAERQALARMDHPNIAQVFDAGATEIGRPYFVMELVQGLKITEYCDRHRLRPHQRLGLFEDICHAVQHAHQKGIIHRDLKPSNILVAQHDTVAVPKVIDFGIAKATEGRLTDKTLYTGWAQMVGTPVYMSPEQAEFSGLDVDTRSDIYSLGVLLYELLTGRTPFEQKTVLQAGFEEIQRLIREVDPPRPSTRLSRLSAAELDTVARARGEQPPRLIGLLRGDLDWIVMKCLEKDRSRRYATASGLAQDLARHLGHEPIRARPPTKVYQFQKWARRNRGVFVAGCAVAAAVAMIAVVSTVAAIRERQHSRLLEESRADLQLRTVELRRNLARQYLHRGQALGEDGDVARALQWMSIGLQQLPEEDGQLRSAILENLASWSSQWIVPDLTLTHDSYVFGADFSPDGQWLVTGTGTGTVTLWSLESGDKLWTRHYRGSKAWPLAVSPDGETLVLSEWKANRAHLLRLSSGEPLGPPLLHAGTIFSVGFSPDGRFAFTVGDHATHIWDARTGLAVGLPVPHEDPWFAIAFSPDSELVFSEGKVGFGQLWRAETGQLVGPPLSHGARIELAAFSPDGGLIATGGGTNWVKLWFAATGQMVREPLVHAADPSSLSFSPDGTRLVTASQDYLVQVWSVSTGTRIGRPIRHRALVIAASFSPDGELLMTVCMDGMVRLWSASTGVPIGWPLSNRTHPGLNLVQFSPNGTKLLTRAESRVLALQTLPALDPAALSLEHLGTIHSAKFTRDGLTFAAGQEFVPKGLGRVGLWSAVTGEDLRTVVDHGDAIWDLEFSPDEQQLLTCGLDGLAQVWEFETGTLLGTLSGHTDDVLAGCYNVDGQFLATGGLGGEARVWSSQTREPVGPWLVHPSTVTDLVFSHPSTHLVTACADGRVRLWDYRNGSCLLLEAPDRPGSLAAVDASPDGRWIVAGGLDKTARFWDARSGDLTGMVLSHEGNVEDITFSPDGHWLLTVTDDGKARLWSVEGGEQIGPTMNQGTLIQECNFSRDGSHVITACSPGVGIWRLPRGTQPPPNQTTLWVEVLTHQTMDAQGTLSWLSRDEWQARKTRLNR
jgi:WD40 repeat protein/serine/threonine protein kinase